MSVNASEHELTQLIYRHLKEHGFHSAADELQRHSPQGETKTSVSLVDIYYSWLNDSKKKRQTISANSKEQGGTPAKGTPKKKNKLANKAETQKKKSVPAKRKKDEGKPAENVIKAKKSKTQTKDKVVNAGGDDSDSDSSLDVEKWKKLVLQMTESDISKMEIINALDTSTPPPVKKRVRKPRVKPSGKDNTPVKQNDGKAGKNEKMEEKDVTDTKHGTPKRSRLKNAPVTPSTPLSQEANTNDEEDRPAVSTPSLSKHTAKKEKKEAVAPDEEKNDETMSEPKKKMKKKKTKEVTEDKVEENTEEICGDGKHKEEEQTGDTEQEFDARPVEQKKKKAKGPGDGKMNKTEGEIPEKIIHGGVDSEQSIVQEKKAKKRKKEKTDGEENSVQPAENVKETTEQAGDSEERRGGEDDMPEEKQTKKKRKDKTVSEENSEQIAEKKQEKKTKEKTISEEENSEQIVTEKKRKKKIKADPDEETFEQVAEENSTTPRKSESSEREDKPEQIAEVKKKKKDSSLENNDTEPLPPANHETSSPAKERKKKKSKLKSVDVPETVSATETLQTPSDTPHKKKKKSSKNTES